MWSLASPLVLLCIQGLCLLVASELSVSLPSQTGSSCQTRRVGVTTERVVSRLARDIITITLTSTSTDTTDCTCTETAPSTTANTEETQTTSSLLASSSLQATASRTSTDVQSNSTDTTITSTVPASTKTTLHDISTVTDWRATTVVSFRTVTADSPTPLPSKSFTSDISTGLAVSTTSDPTQDLSVSTRYTTVTVHDTSYSTQWETTALTDATPTSQSVWLPSSDASTMSESGALLPSSAGYGQSSTATTSTSTALVLDTSAIDASQVETSATGKSSPSSESAPYESTGSVTSTEEVPTLDPSASILYPTVTVHDTSSATIWTTATRSSDTTVIQSTWTFSSDSSTSPGGQVTLSSSMSSVGSPAPVVSTTTTTTVVRTGATESPREVLSTTIVATTTGDAVSSPSHQLSTHPSDRSADPTEGGLDSAPVGTTFTLSDTTYTTAVSAHTVPQSNADGSGGFTDQSSIDRPTESTISSRARSSPEPIVTLVNPVSISADSSEGQAQTDGRSDTATTSSRLSLSICPTRISNPTYTPTSLPPRDYTWGCPPHFLCRPSRKTAHGECNFEAGPPADSYYCAPEECIPSPPIPHTSSQGSTTSSGQIRYTVAPGFINLSPLQFGLGYEIFEFLQSRAKTLRKRAVKIPGKCYDSCNNAMEAAESITKTQELCSPGSPFQVSHRACRSCVESGSGVRTSSSALPEFQQFLFYCEESANVTLTKQSPSAAYSRGKSSSSPSSTTSTRGTAYPSPTQTVRMGTYTLSDVNSASTSRIEAASSRLPASTTSHRIYTGGASWRCPARFLWVTTSVFLLGLWWTL
ncbi:hypothetical protein N7508_011160 [Penicillium antarcticum]|uniref:uncharacterized protein n=1 Tax=Penicillium antarcticum TaxID=416450 RepID=UPI00239B890C|nr:uncharacterized protein N7508_011150 [Penicillium antarcticum]XP_058314198.1 uncharacterized protein N7508_011160 [Penicillium antarcticum]KAJ5288375.1 hypothetical protein N7508_011150 [Penicillium antarcticum]KAJ5288385.1 hypothetical protein N7508_011160 [Penicillium antarcticum]